MMFLDLLNGTKLRRAARYLLYLAGALRTLLGLEGLT